MEFGRTFQRHREYTLRLGLSQVIYSFDTQAIDTGIPAFLKRIGELGVEYKALHTEQSSLEDIFVSLVHAK